MADLPSINGEIQLSLRLLGKSYDPFQKDLEWFEYELVVEGRERDHAPAPEAPEAPPVPTLERRAVRGKINRKDFNELLRGLDELIKQSRAMRFEPYDLNFYFEWSHETPLVYLIVTWFDLALAPRRFDQRFPTSHVGFRFLADANSLAEFRRAVEEEFMGAAQPMERRSSTLIN